MTTKEKIIDEALTLFSINGFNGTSVKSIANAVGIKDSSLYKHFKSKQEILDTIVKSIYNQIEHMSDKFGLPPEKNIEKAAEIFAKFSEDDLVHFSKHIFLFYLNDSVISRFWRMGNIEQYQNPDVYKVFSELFLEQSISYQTELFSEMIKKNVFIDIDPSVMAMSFYAPIYFLLSKYNNTYAKEAEAVNFLEKQAREFYRVYRKKELTK